MNNDLKINIEKYCYNSSGKIIINDFNIEIPYGSFFCIIGPSGCGKSTILKIVSGLLQLKCGTVSLNNRIYNSSTGVYTPKEMVIVFQDCNRSLMPWLNVRENVVWSLVNKKISKKDKELIANDALHKTGLGSFVNKYPHQLSGGQKQRLALARAIAYKPKILLLDEPFNSLDFCNRNALDNLLSSLWKSFGFTILLVTHEIEEAICLAEKIIILSNSPSKILHSINENLPIKNTAHDEYHQIRKKIVPFFSEFTHEN